MARFRTSSHYLRVETGRFSGVRYPQRACEHGGMGVEDEWHAASVCTFSEHLRAAHGLAQCMDMVELMKQDARKLGSYIDSLMKLHDAHYLEHSGSPGVRSV